MIYTYEKDTKFRLNNDQGKSNDLATLLENAKKERSYSASNLCNKMRLYLTEKNSELKVTNINSKFYIVNDVTYNL